MYISRNIRKTIEKAKKNFSCITLTGSIGVGKSTLLQKIFPNFNYVNLNDEEILNLALSNPKLFLTQNKTPLVIINIEKAPKLLSLIKIIIDENKFNCLKDNKPNELLFVLTCSNEYKLKQLGIESLAGRTALLNLASLTYGEIRGLESSGLFNPDINALISKKLPSEIRTRKEIFEDIFRGGMPEYVTSKIDRDMFFSSYIGTYLERDVKELISVTNVTTFKNFLSYIALRTSQQVDYTDISNAIGISTKTVKEWLSILKESGIIVFLEPYMKNMSNRIVKTPKIYFMDTGLCAYLCKWPTSEMLENGVMNGAFYETYVVSELIKNYYNNGLDPFGSLYYYRDRDQKEVDLIIDTINGIYPIEIKKGINPVSSKKNFDFLSKYGKHVYTGLIIDSCDKVRPINETTYYVPLTLINL